MANCAARRLRLGLEERETHRGIDQPGVHHEKYGKNPSKTLKDLIIQELNQVQAA